MMRRHSTRQVNPSWKQTIPSPAAVFFRGSTALAAAAALTPSPLFAESAPAPEVEIPDDGWRMWPDTDAPWKDDPLFLPDEVDLARLPVNPPTGGWPLSTRSRESQSRCPPRSSSTIGAVSAPAPTRMPNTNTPNQTRNSATAHTAASPGSGAASSVPEHWAGKQVTLHIRGYRQRIEVFVNQQLTGYDLIAETSYDCDITPALKPGTNPLALRITNPGGVYDWRDYTKLRWGAR